MAGLEPGLYAQRDQMQQDIDAMGGGNAVVAAGDGPIMPPPGMQGQQPPDPAALMQNMIHNMMQPMMDNSYAVYINIYMYIYAYVYIYIIYIYIYNCLFM